MQGSAQETPALKMVNIRDGLYFISFQPSFLSALQCFSIAVAIIHSQSPSLHPKHVQHWCYQRINISKFTLARIVFVLLIAAKKAEFRLNIHDFLVFIIVIYYRGDLIYSNVISLCVAVLIVVGMGYLHNPNKSNVCFCFPFLLN